MTTPSPGETKALSFSKIKTPPNVYFPCNSWKVSTQVQSELAKHELKQSKVYIHLLYDFEWVYMRLYVVYI